MRIKVSYEVDISPGFYGEMEDKIKVFFTALGFDDVGSGSNGTWRDIEFKTRNEVCGGSSLFEHGETPFSPPPTVL